MATDHPYEPSPVPDAGGSEPPWRRGVVWAVAIAGVVAAVGLGLVASLWWYADQRIEREAIPALDNDGGEDGARLDRPLTFLVVGSDSRDDVTDEERRELRLGDFEHAQADTILLVQALPDEGASIVSVPRDLRLVHDGRARRINAMLDIGGPDLVVRAVEHLSGVKIDHYVEVSVIGFVKVVDAIGTVEICLDDELRDEKSGADFDAGCHDMDGTEALSYVRSREGPRGDFERMERQHRFISAVLDELTATRTLVDVPRLFRIVDAGAPYLRTDDGLGMRQMRRLAEQMRSLADGEIESTVVPAFAEEIDGIPYMIAYEPGAEAVFRSLRSSEPIAPRGHADGRAETRVGIWTAHRGVGADRVASTLHFAAFEPAGLGPGPVEPPSSTVVYVLDDEEAADWVAAVLGASVEPLPADVDRPDGVDVVVVVGADAEFAFE